MMGATVADTAPFYFHRSQYLKTRDGADAWQNFAHVVHGANSNELCVYDKASGWICVTLS